MGNIHVLGEWSEDLIWCPSQCYLKIKHEGKPFEIYLRWRWDDPWTCRLLKDDDFIGEELFSLFQKSWSQDDDLKVIEASAIECVQKYLSLHPDL